jgi:hypothetical protein
VRLNHLPAPRLALILLAGGVLLLLPGACSLATSGPTRDDVGVAFEKVVQVGLDSFRTGAPVRFSFTVPDSAQWARIRKSWGDRGYIALGVRREGRTEWIVPFSTLDLDLKVTRSGESLPLESATEPPYGYSSSGQGDHGVMFKPRPGDEVAITITARRSETLPAGDLVIEPYWDGYAKDHIVGAMLESDLRPYVWSMTILGIGLLAASAALGIAAARNVART